MAEDEEEEESGPVVELGDREHVEGAPLARPLARLHYGIAKSEVVRRIGDEEIRTPDGPRTVEDALSNVDETYFPAREDLHGAIQDVVGRGPIPTTEPPEDEGDEDSEEGADEQSGASEGADDESEGSDGESTEE
jgi:hypothetical protein